MNAIGACEEAPGRATSTAETWLPVVGYEESYEVSDRGRVRSLDRKVPTSDGLVKNLRGSMMKLTDTNAGRMVVNLRRPGHGKTWKVHQLVMLAFFGPCPEGMEICHTDGNYRNNALENLRYDTSSSNNYDLVEHGVHYWAKRDSCIRGHKFTGPNLRILLNRDGSFKQRQCVACDRAHKYAWMNPEYKPTMSELADDYYKKIMGESV